MITILKILLVINIITFIVFAIDKMAAIEGSQRFSEEILLILAFVGGGIGANIAMLLFHHKTSKNKFNKIIPILAIMDFIVISYIIFFKI